MYLSLSYESSMHAIVTHDVFRLLFVVLLILGLILGAVGSTGLVDVLKL